MSLDAVLDLQSKVDIYYAIVKEMCAGADRGNFTGI